MELVPTPYIKIKALQLLQLLILQSAIACPLIQHKLLDPMSHLGLRWN